MEKSLFKQTGGTYTQQDDYLLPNLILPAEKESVSEKLKANNQMLWVQKMNNIRERAREVVNSDVIFV